MIEINSVSKRQLLTISEFDEDNDISFEISNFGDPAEMHISRGDVVRLINYLSEQLDISCKKSNNEIK